MIADPYIHNRYFGTDFGMATSTKFGLSEGANVRVAMDCHEARFHSKFNNSTNENNHEHLRNWNKGECSLVLNSS